MPLRVALALPLALASLPGANCAGQGSLLYELLKDYDRDLLPPTLPGQPVQVNVSLTFEEMWGVSDESKTYDVDIYLGQSWHDPRLAWDPARHHNITELMLTHEEDMFALWMPDTFWYHLNFFIKRKHVQAYLRINMEGELYMSQQAVMNMRCVMDLRRFPFDTQECGLTFGSYSRPKEFLDYNWAINNRYNKRISGKAVSHRPGFVKGELALFPADDSSICPSRTIWQINGGPEYRQMVVSVHLKRKFMHYIWNSFVPSFAVVLIAYCSYWIGPYAAPARVSLVVVSSLTSTVFLNSAKAYMVSPYMTALELYVLIHFLLVLGAMFEYTLVNFLLTFAFELNPPSSAAGMKARQRKAEKRLRLLRALRSGAGGEDDEDTDRDLISPGNSPRNSPHLRELRCIPGRDGRDELYSLSESDTGGSSTLSPSELFDFFNATDVACRGKVSMEDIEKAAPMLGIEGVQREDLRAMFADISGGHKSAENGATAFLNRPGFSEFIALTVPMATLDALPRGVHVEPERQPFKARFGRLVTYYMSDDPLILDRWMRIIALTAEVLWQIFYWFVWLSNSEWLKSNLIPSEPGATTMNLEPCVN